MMGRMPTIFLDVPRDGALPRDMVEDEMVKYQCVDRSRRHDFFRRTCRKEKKRTSPYLRTIMIRVPPERQRKTCRWRRA